ncbi:MAG TPA: hypothetical protein VHF89_02210, partial [Solirubrobacteraceae bacterium]|nr:hypothetical protein [Solirubrobacteraceae bacterium]
MRTLALMLLALAALAAGAVAAERALRAAEEDPSAGISVESGRPVFALRNLRHGDRAERCVAVTNEGPGVARGAVLGRSEGGDLARLLRLVVTRGCGSGGTVLFSGTLADFAAAADPEPWPAGARRQYRLAVEVAGSDAEVQGRRAVHEFAFGVEGAEVEARADSREEPAAEAPSLQAPPTVTCRTISFAPAGKRKRPVLIKRHRVNRRVDAKLILRIYGALGQQRLVLVTGLRVGRDVLMGRRWGSVSYRVGDGAAVTS